MNALGIIFADEYDVDIPELTETRTLASIPFGARYRVIDFVLSNMTNAGIHEIGIITTHRYESLMGHVRGGAEWDLDRKQSSLTILPPFSFNNPGRGFENLMEALRANLSYLIRSNDEYVVIMCSNCVGNIDLQAMMEFHQKNDSDVTVMYTKDPKNKFAGVSATEYLVDSTGRVQDMFITDKGIAEGACTGTNTYIMKREDLIHFLMDRDQADAKSIRKDLILPNLKTLKIMGYETKETVLYLDNVSAYLQSSLALLDAKLRDELFHQENHPIITRVGDSSPVWYGPNAKVTNSLIAAGSIIEGEVTNSVIFRGVHIKKGAKVENSVIMRKSTIGEGAYLNYAVLDKNVIINDKRILSGYITHPFAVRYASII